MRISKEATNSGLNPYIMQLTKVCNSINNDPIVPPMLQEWMQKTMVKESVPDGERWQTRSHLTLRWYHPLYLARRVCTKAEEWLTLVHKPSWSGQSPSGDLGLMSRNISDITGLTIQSTTSDNVTTVPKSLNSEDVSAKMPPPLFVTSGEEVELWQKPSDLCAPSHSF